MAHSSPPSNHGQGLLPRAPEDETKQEGSITLSPLEILLLKIAAGFYLGAFVFFLADILSGKGKAIPWAGVTAGVGGVLLHTLSLFILFTSRGHITLNTLREAVSFFSWSLVVVFLFLEHQRKAHILGILVFPVSFLSVLFVLDLKSGSSLMTGSTTSILVSLHSILIDLGLSSAALAFFVSSFYLLLDFFLKRKIFNPVFDRLPSLEFLDRLNREFNGLGFLFLTLGLVFVMIWSYRTYNLIWPWGKRGSWTLVVWFLYLAIVLLWRRGRFRGKQAAYVSIAGFFLFAVTILAINLYIGGGHSVF